MCQSRVRLPDDAAGKKFRCPKCKGTIAVKGAVPPPQPLVQRGAMSATGFTDAPHDPTIEGILPVSDPVPLSSLAKKAIFDEFNPFDDGTSKADDAESEKKSRFQPKEIYNPFAQPHPPDAPASEANPEDLFDFGREDAPQQPASGEFNFGNRGDG
jgi:hypothetical protein